MTNKELNTYIFFGVIGLGAFYFWNKNERLKEFDERELALMEEEADRKAKADESKKKKKKKSKVAKVKPIKKKATPPTQPTMTMGSSMASSSEGITPENAPTEQANSSATQEPDTESFVDDEKDEDGWTIGAKPSQPYIVNVSSAQGGAVKIGGLPTAMPTPMMNMDGEGNLIVNDKPSAPESRLSANGKWNNEVLFGFDDGIEDIDDVDEFYEDFGEGYEEAYEDYVDEEEDFDYINKGHDAKKHFDNKSKLNFDLDDTIY